MRPLYDFGILSNDFRVLSRIQEIAGEFNFTFNHWKSTEELQEATDDYRLIIAALTDSESRKKTAETAQMIRQLAPSAFIICTVAGTLGKESAAQTKSAGANLIFLEEEVLSSSKLDYACNEIIRASYLAIKASDLVPGKELGFDIYHLLPQRKKFLKFAFEGDVLAQEKLDKINAVGEIYIGRDCAIQFSTYVKKHQEQTPEGLAKRCRAEFLALYASYANLAFLLTDQSENASYKEGEALVKKCRILAAELVGTLLAHGNAFDIVNNSTVGNFGSVERTPAIAAYAGLYALQFGIEDADEIMMGALLGNIGLLLLPSSITEKIRRDVLKELTDSELPLYQNYVNESLSLALGRKLPIENRLREIILSPHERADGKGFPRGISEDKLASGAQLLRFCSDLDRRTLVALGKSRNSPQETLKKMALEYLETRGLVTADFGTQLRKNFL